MAKKINPIKMMKQKVHISKYVMSQKPWSEVKFFDQIMMDALMKHVFGLIQYGMTDFGEIMDTLGHMRSNDEDGWVDAWADRGNTLKKKAEAKGKLISTSQQYLRASSYYRIGLMYFSKPEDPRMELNSLESRKCYEKYLNLSDYPGEYVEIPYEDNYLPGHFYRSPIAEKKHH